LLHNDCWTHVVLKPLLEYLGWAIYVVFVAEFLTRWVIHPSSWRFLRERWWEIPILLLPFLRFVRVLRLARTLGGLFRSGRSSGERLRTRLVRIGAAHVVVVLGAANLLCDYGGYASPIAGLYANARYLHALHDVAFAATSGEPLSLKTGLAQSFEVALAVWSVVVFTSMAATLGDFFLSRRRSLSEGQ
jgi:voltage-gated potassium channel